MLDRLEGKVAVVTGGAGGIGLAMGRAFAAQGMRVVLADVEEPALTKAAGEIGALGVLADVTSENSMRELADRVYEAHGAAHLLCNNAGIGPAAAPPMWEQETGDWRWGLDVNVLGILHGLRAFLPRMIASGEPGHVVNTASGNGGVAPIPSAAVYAVTKAAVVTLTECLYGQLGDTAIGASVLFPGPHMLRTGIFTAERNRPARYARTVPGPPARDADEVAEMLRAHGVDPRFTPVEEVADQVVEAVREDRFWILPDSDRTDAMIHARTESMRTRSTPTYLRGAS
ncbi:SDR family NAD(P)-dependent oxidoreductase [Actinomadura barringtoniae]|uniref:SDR family NAD(P)-dependent oxidoreductase n=1 Tax=Actinomadura barringtoniae TaxID=1427535 RepID=A0A939P8I5_9ACTN|nr:SDR family NAD(P)-dependent oxidoreductase [Actinomadura barringtoniae]MBO2447317.1 SDR family NAD(P)-dependent oxidoreductase [Actinomadura barringtoniae]